MDKTSPSDPPVRANATGLGQRQKSHLFAGLSEEHFPKSFETSKKKDEERGKNDSKTMRAVKR